MTRVPFGVTVSPFILAETFKYRIRKYSQETKHSRHETVQMLNSTLYADDLSYGADTVAKALDPSQSAVEIHKETNMN
ncbi:reverse transcriptase domain-containing protein [Nephila pilipes]|uniref:Reverse transcriptase domain-containing protein n=1 Tax=Nephila pilipes TaxID=299642 RepID=A0A8X6TJ82_NEPPI|nr:reverse transcriptase domain-containing protein [Nephila pilipes]